MNAYQLLEHFAPVQFVFNHHREAASSPVKSCQGFFVPSYQEYNIVNSGVVPPCYGCNGHSSPMVNRAGQRDGQHRFLLPKNVQNISPNVKLPSSTCAFGSRSRAGAHLSDGSRVCTQPIRRFLGANARIRHHGAVPWSASSHHALGLQAAAAIAAGHCSGGSHGQSPGLSPMLMAPSQDGRERFSSKFCNLQALKPQIP